MVPNLLMALGLVLILAGAFLKLRSPTAAEVAAMEAPAPTSGLSDEEKGYAFERWVADRFPKQSFDLKHWRSDKMTPNGRYAESNKDPDMEVDLVLGTKRYPFAVECKWRARMNDGTMKFAEPYQIENYKAYMKRTGRPVFVVGEVSATEDRPKIFLQELFPLEDAPRRLTLQVHLRLRLAELSPDRLRRARELVGAHPGDCPLFLCLQRADGAAAFVEVNDRYRVQPSLDLQRALEGEFGAGAYFAKADPALPERPRRRWEQASSGDGG